MKNQFQVFFRTIVPIITFSFILCLEGAAQDQQAIDSLKQLIEETKQDTIKVFALLQLGGRFHYSQPDTANKYYHEALELADEIDYAAGKAEAFRDISTYLQLKGANDAALEYLMKAQDLFNIIGISKQLATCL